MQVTLQIGALLVVASLLLSVQGIDQQGNRRSGLSRHSHVGPRSRLFDPARGISGSGRTLTVSLMRGIRQEDALLIYFLISVPKVLGAIVLNGSLGAHPWRRHQRCSGRPSSWNM